MGILLAITALFSWGLGDFLIEKSTRKFGDWIALFYITAFGAVILFPFVYRDIIPAFTANSFILWITSLVIFLAALFNLHALRVGKISVVEPIFAFEVPVAGFLAAFLLNERLSFAQIFFIAALVIGIILVSTRSFSHFKNIRTEKGVGYAVVGTIGLGISGFLYGLGSRETSPLMINWVSNAFMAVITFFYLTATGKLAGIAGDFKENKRLILNVSFFDNLAWITFSYATLYIPIAIAMGVSEGYIAFAGGLGLLFNKEKLKVHQWVGFCLAAVAVVVLAVITDK
ncbi:MAG: DMT family transporter [Minisyncoccia bacterium]|jgi:drug/metabolite transporter (DMT)-like permease